MRRVLEIGVGLALGLAFDLGSGCAADAPTMTLGLNVQPSAIAFRPDGGRWAELVQLAQSTTSTLYELPHADGVLAVACLAADGTFQVEELFATATDLDELLYAQLEPWPILGCAPPPAQHALVEVSGRLLQGGQIYLGDYAGMEPGGSLFDADVEVGTHDLVVVGQQTVLIRHDQGLFAPFVEPDIDLSEGSPIATVTLEGDVIGSFDSIASELITVNGTHVVFASRDVTAFLVPPQELETGDVELVQMVREGQGFLDVVTGLATSGVTPIISVLDNPVGTTFSTTAVSADWTTAGIPGFSDARVAYSTPAGSLAATATAAWLREHGATSVTFDETFPEFRWPIEPDAAQRAFTIDQRLPNLVMAATIFEPD